MEKKTEKMKLRKDIYGQEVPDDIPFHEYWERQHKLEELSLQESIRQREYRKKWQADLTQIGVKVCAICGNEECICEYFDEAKVCGNHTDSKRENGECCQTKGKQ